MSSDEVWAVFNKMLEAIHESNLHGVLKRQFMTALTLDQMFYTETGGIPLYIARQQKFLERQVLYAYGPNTQIRDQVEWFTSIEGEGGPRVTEKLSPRYSPWLAALGRRQNVRVG